VRIISLALTATLGGLVLCVAGCAPESQSQAYGHLDSAVPQTQQRSLGDRARSGRSLRYLTLPRLPQPTLQGSKLARSRDSKVLYISDFRSVLLYKNGSYKHAGSITKGLVSPDGDYVDAAGNFYVADYDGAYIQEYKSGGKSPSFTYRHGMIDPTNVSVDTHGNVYEADYNGWYVNEYAQKSNAVINSCSPGGGVEGVAVDANGDVFVDYNQSSYGMGRIAEYKGGLAGCNETTFSVSLDFAGGMVLDAHGNLIVVDQTAPAVDVIAPPYSSISGTCGSGYLAPFMVTLNKSNNLAFVTDLYDVYVVDYPSCSPAAPPIGFPYGEAPAGAVDSENAVY
jgi:hypothetical protein